MKNIGVIGLGSIGMRHAKNLIGLGHTVYGTDKDHKREKELVVAGGKPVTTHVGLSQCDAIVIASPTKFHIEHIDLCISENRQFFVEKPVANTMDSVIVPPADIAKAIMVGYNLRFHSCVIQARNWIDAGLLGKPIWSNLVCAQLNTKADYLRDGVILNWSHEIDLALYLLGHAFCRGCVARRDETIADLVLLHDNGCQSTIHLDYLTVPEVRQTIIVGTHATIVIDIVNRHCWLKSTTGVVVDHFQGYDDWDSNYKDEMETFIARLDGQETVGCTGSEAIDVLKICLDAKQMASAQ